MLTACKAGDTCLFRASPPRMFRPAQSQGPLVLGLAPAFLREWRPGSGCILLLGPAAGSHEGGKQQPEAGRTEQHTAGGPNLCEGACFARRQNRCTPPFPQDRCRRCAWPGELRAKTRNSVPAPGSYCCNGDWDSGDAGLPRRIPGPRGHWTCRFDGHGARLIKVTRSGPRQPPRESSPPRLASRERCSAMQAVFQRPTRQNSWPAQGESFGLVW